MSFSTLMKIPVTNHHFLAPTQISVDFDMNQSDAKVVNPWSRKSLCLGSSEDNRSLTGAAIVSRRSLRRTSSLVAVVATIVTFSSTSSAFILRSTISYRSRIILSAKDPKSSSDLKTKEYVVKQVQPKTSISDEARQKAVDAMNAKMLELLSDSFLVSPNFPRQEKGGGRFSMVEGAMNFETMLNFQKRSSNTNMVPVDSQFSSVVPFTNEDGTRQNKLQDLGLGEFPSKRKKKGSVKGSDSQEGNDVGGMDPTGVSEIVESGEKKRKKVYKNLPQSRTRGEPIRKENQGKGTSLPFDLSLYNGSQLLTAEEEYTLGMQVRFMVKCEQVHEGLSRSFKRLPSIQEWAIACGFVEEDKNFVATEADNYLRPVGSEQMFVKKDPNMFVGNGLASEIGVGRGRGRVKYLPPPTELVDFFDDSANKFRKPGTPRKPKTPINRGTPTDFVEMLMEANEAKQIMISSNMRLVVSIAKKFYNVGVSLSDLVQEGSIGLSKAADRFDPKKGFKFSTYASWWIQQGIFRSIAYHSRTIRLPVHIHHLLNRIRRVRHNLELQLGRGPSNIEMATELEMSVEKYNKMMLLTRQSISLEAPRYKYNKKDSTPESMTLIVDTIAATESTTGDLSLEQGVDRNLFHADIIEMLEVLEHDERRVICARYGLDDGLTRTVTAVAAQLKQTKAWVRSQEGRALRKLRRPWYEKKLKEHQDSLTN